jgi:hypothetical protein
VSKGRFYYVAEAYPVLLAMGAVVWAEWLTQRPVWMRRTVATVYFIALAGVGAYVTAILLPIARSGPLRDFALKNNGDLREEIGWDELVRSVAAVRDGMTPEQKANFGILTGNYGEAGAIENLGGPYQLPLPISLTNSFYLRSYPANEPTTVIVVGWSRDGVDHNFTGCRLPGHISNAEGVKNEESEYHPDIFVCGAPKAGWRQFWKEHQRFG